MSPAGMDIAALAAENWSPDCGAVQQLDVGLVKSIYRTTLRGRDKAQSRALIALEFTQYLERYLWPTFDAETACKEHVLSIVLLVIEKCRQSLSPWIALASRDPSVFSAFFSRVCHLRLEAFRSASSSSVLTLSEDLSTVQFLIRCFEALENDLVRPCALRLVSLPIWTAMSPGRVEMELKRRPELLKPWKVVTKRLAKAAKAGKTAAKSEIGIAEQAAVLPSLLRSMRFYLLGNPEDVGAERSWRSEWLLRCCELVIDLLSQLPTRRFVHALVEDLQLHVCASSSAWIRSNASLRTISASVSFYVHFECDDETGAALSDDQVVALHSSRIQSLQRVAFKCFPVALEALALSNIGALEDPKKLRMHLANLADEEVVELCVRLRLIAADEPEKKAEESTGGETFESRVAERETSGFLRSRELLIATICEYFCRRSTLKEQIANLPLYPCERVLWHSAQVSDSRYSGHRGLSLPKLNLQFLTLADYLWRTFHLYRLESSYEIRCDIEDAVQRLRPVADVGSGRVNETAFRGWARMATTVQALEVKEVAPARVGETRPGKVSARLEIPYASMPPAIQREWTSLRSHDVLFLVSIRMRPDTERERETFYPSAEAVEREMRAGMGETDAEGERDREIDIDVDTDAVDIANPSAPLSSNADADKEKERERERDAEDLDFRTAFGVLHVRGCEVESLQDEGGNVYTGLGAREGKLGGSRRFINVSLDEAQYATDVQNGNVEDLYNSFNVVVRRKPEENNFRAVLHAIRDLMTAAKVAFPQWLHDTFLGYGDARDATEECRTVRTLTLRDSLLDAAHADCSLRDAGYEVEWKDAEVRSPPYRVEFGVNSDSQKKTATLTSLGDSSATSSASSASAVESLTGPARHNTVRFTPRQLSAILSALQPGLTVISGPPGTGKTDVAVQAISELYHNFPGERVLIVTHSNHALNDVFEKIIEREIDERHCIRLGHGEEALETSKDFSRTGRVNHMLSRRQHLLTVLQGLASTLSFPVEQSASFTCETASNFFHVEVLGRWERFCVENRIDPDRDADEDRDGESVGGFPFAEWVESVGGRKVETAGEARRWWKYLCDVREELEDCRVFEILRSGYDRANYLLTRQARIIAMTCTHAALTRDNLLRLSFAYDTVVMEEAAQVLDIETVIPMLLQQPGAGRESRLKRVVLLGDHHQLPPVVKHQAFQRFAHLDQSLFARLVRLGVPRVMLDAQGRARSSLADLYRWRYPGLADLPHIADATLANPGLAFDFQVVDVQDFNGRGETTPTAFFYQNLGEAEYIVSMFQYLRLLGYPSERITVLTTYNGQKALLKDVFTERCAGRSFGMPAKITTVDKYQGQQNDIVLLSLVRTRSVGHVRDIRRLIVAVSRARLGLYVFCRYALFAQCIDLVPVFSRLATRPQSLCLVAGETYANTVRPLNPPPPSDAVLQVQDVMHMGAIVNAMAAMQPIPQRVEPVNDDDDDEMADAPQQSEESPAAKDEKVEETPVQVEETLAAVKETPEAAQEEPVAAPEEAPREEAMDVESAAQPAAAEEKAETQPEAPKEEEEEEEEEEEDAAEIVAVTGGKYEGRRGRVVRETAKSVRVRLLDGETGEETGEEVSVLIKLVDRHVERAKKRRRT